ncbi:hypothetical protein PAPYR_419 [Paratrimastix pyriformis]|uniref:Uncharacterized protein n=1 Tax=Paratrimastix pyriformis TaxID=342808 RepID=A0ABQ8UXG7_9EUKA|nr:hypothetical protein PAPYR_419 [Paratrimastix pyriformis]
MAADPNMAPDGGPARVPSDVGGGPNGGVPPPPGLVPTPAGTPPPGGYSPLYPPPGMMGGFMGGYTMGPGPYGFGMYGPAPPGMFYPGPQPHPVRRLTFEGPTRLCPWTSLHAAAAPVGTSGLRCSSVPALRRDAPVTWLAAPSMLPPRGHQRPPACLPCHHGRGWQQQRARHPLAGASPEFGPGPLLPPTRRRSTGIVANVGVDGDMRKFILLCLFALFLGVVSAWDEHNVHIAWATSERGGLSSPDIDFVAPGNLLGYLETFSNQISKIAPQFLSMFAMSSFRIILGADIPATEQIPLIESIFWNQSSAWFACPLLAFTTEPKTLEKFSLLFPQVIAAPAGNGTQDLITAWTEDETLEKSYLAVKQRCSICGAPHPEWRAFSGPGSRYPRAIGSECLQHLRHGTHQCKPSQDESGYECILQCQDESDRYCDDPDTVVTIGGIPVEAATARFGGIIVQRTDWPPKDAVI